MESTEVNEASSRTEENLLCDKRERNLSRVENCVVSLSASEQPRMRRCNTSGEGMLMLRVCENGMNVVKSQKSLAEKNAVKLMWESCFFVCPEYFAKIPFFPQTQLHL